MMDLKTIRRLHELVGLKERKPCTIQSDRELLDFVTYAIV
jgi:hypothetical protein